jgi:hypothetical protein
MKRGKAQVWIETVIYTLLGLVVIGLLLAFAKPKIDSIRDKSIIEQSLSSFNSLNAKMEEIEKRGPENSRQIDMKISRGRLILDPANDKISWIIESTYKFSELGYVVTWGDLKINTTQKGKKYYVEIFKMYPSNILVNNYDSPKKEIVQSQTMYSFIIKNNGISAGKVNLDISV